MYIINPSSAMVPWWNLYSMPDTMFMVEKCCFCIELRIGCLVIAYVQLLIEILTFGLALYGIVGGAVMLKSTVEALNELGFIMVMFSILFLVFQGLILVFTVVLIIGLHKRNRGYIRAYLICAMIYIMVYATTCFISFPVVEVTALDITYKVVSLVLYVYFMFVVRSYWNRMRQNSRTIYRT